MHVHTLETWRHQHRFFDEAAAAAGQRRVVWVVVLTAVTMVAEVAAGWLFNSMALLADGWHMGSHAAALGITVFAYGYARRHADDRRYTFGTGKVGVLGGFASALVLAVIAVLMVWESADRLIHPLTIAFDQALVVAVVGLLVNLASAWLLMGRAGGGHAHADAHAHDHALRGATLHVLADAVTSVLAIAALLAGLLWGWVWVDAAVGIIGAVVIGRWAYGLLRDTGVVLLDGAAGEEQTHAIRSAIEADADNRIADLHVWYVGPRHLAAIVSVVTHYPRPPEHYKALLATVPDLVHLTVEVCQCHDDPCLPDAGPAETPHQN